GFLHRVQLVALRQAFDRSDLPALRLHGEHQAGAHRLVVEDDGTGAADAVLAAYMGAGLPAVVADGVDQRLARLDAYVVVAPVDVEGDVDFFGHGTTRRVGKIACSVTAPWAKARGRFCPRGTAVQRAFAHPTAQCISKPLRHILAELRPDVRVE